MLSHQPYPIPRYDTARDRDARRAREAYRINQQATTILGPAAAIGPAEEFERLTLSRWPYHKVGTVYRLDMDMD